MQDDFRAVRVPPGAAGRRLKLGKLEVSYPDEGAVEVRTGFAREIRVVFPVSPPARPTVRCGGQAHSAQVRDGAVEFDARAGETCRVERGPAR